MQLQYIFDYAIRDKVEKELMYSDMQLSAKNRMTVIL